MPTTNLLMAESITVPTPSDANHRVIECREGQELELVIAAVLRFEKAATKAARRLECRAERIVCMTAHGI